MSYTENTKDLAMLLRSHGFSLRELADRLHVAKSTVSGWVRNVKLDEDAQSRLADRIHYGKEQSKIWWEERKKEEREIAMKEASSSLSKIEFSQGIARVYCALLYWAEGAKRLNKVGFMNSDPTMIRFFLKALRKGFRIDETKLRVLLHLHDYHKEPEMVHYWSGVTGIPLAQFNKTYFKPHTKKRIHEGYKGSCSLSYYDARIARVLTALYNTLAGDA